jgi:DNA-binding NarL/FixJ family response regulator
LEISRGRVLVVDDYEPFRRFVCSTVRQKSELQIVGEASDGLEAVHKTEELRPDLVVLDIGLPTISGIEVARRIRKLSPQSKIIFVSQECSTDVVQEALASGASGYVVKQRAATELLEAIGSVLDGRKFITGQLSGHHFTDASQASDSCRDEALPSLAPRNRKITRGHKVEFYPDGAAFVVGFVNFIEAALKDGNVIIAVTTESHRKSILQRLQEHSIDIGLETEQGRYLSLDVDDVLSRFMANDLPDPEQFFKVVSDLIATAARAIAGEASRVSICGEGAAILWARGKADAAVQLERLCNQLTKRYEMALLCGFSLSSFLREEDKQIFQEICSK